MNVAKVSLNQYSAQSVNTNLKNSNKTNISFGLGCSKGALAAIDTIELNARKGLKKNALDETCKGVLEDIENIKKSFKEYKSNDLYLRVIKLPVNIAKGIKQQIPVFAVSIRHFRYASFFPGNLENSLLRHKDLVEALKDTDKLRVTIIRQDGIIEQWVPKSNK